ncbi:MAG: hydantoinase B/oxoprolinase family protein [Alphaproteobacteria bacterium]|nr:hydantoinase B/oxoprolinase family protein [Alphaproteobacteria bacterium]
MTDARAAWMDQGGTFTDLVHVAADGSVRVDKVLSAWADLTVPPQVAARRGTTVATNALLERRGAPVLLLTTAGFGDAPWIGDQVRPRLFGLRQDPPRPLCAAVVEVEGRIGTGPGEGPATLLRPHRVDEEALARHRAAGIEAVAVVLVHGPLLPEEERALGRACRAAGFRHVSLGHEVAPSRGFLARLHTTLADAALTPLLPRLPGHWMRSDGGLAAVDVAGHGPEWRGAQAVLSGPAGGVVATAVLARQAAVGPVFGFDMGGTSTDVSRVVDGVPRRDHVSVDGLRLRVPAVRIDTVAAGGGSVLSVQGGVYRVGPSSAGADPGPACYGRGGPAAVTDCEAVLGRLPGFPPIAGPTRDQPLDVDAARAALQALDPARPVEEIARGFLAVATETMARAVRGLAAGQGADPAAHALVAFGGAGPGHACRVARALGISRVLVPHLAGVFSAVGIGLARPRIERVAPVQTTVAAACAAAGADLDRALRAAGDPGAWRRRFVVALRHVGRSTLIEVEVGADGGTEAERAAAFHQAHARRFGFARPELSVEAVEVRASAEPIDDDRRLPGLPALPDLPASSTPACFSAWGPVPLLRPDAADGRLGPLIVQGAGATVVVESGWQVRCCDGWLELVDRGAPPVGLSTAFHPVHTAVLGARVMAVAEQMGERLARLSRSVSIRERHDFSCAVFDADGQLVANAPHVPVHLGAMGQTVRDLLAARGDAVGPGTAWATNDPYAGGSHLPDITVVMPVFVDGRRIALVACRGHHIDVGGSRPGSMPPDARHIDDEGFVLRHVRLLADGVFEPPAELSQSRQPDDVFADLQAQVAACRSGCDAVEALVQDLGTPVFQAQLDHLQAVAERAVRALLPGLVREVEEEVWLDAGEEAPHPLRVALSLTGEGGVLRLDGDAHPGNLNAPRAVAVACLLYVFRCLVDRHGGDLPLNEGALRPFRIEVQPGGLFDPRFPAAVAGGNVETSQRLVDALLSCLGALAGSQGTMNNLSVGTPTGAFYETIGGGLGAGPDHDGAHGLQVHMTNTRGTDVEELELRFPVRLLQHGRRRGSGGGGAFVGGDGVVKEWCFLAPAEVSLLAGRRRVPAPGLGAGREGAPGVDLRDQGEGFEPAPGTWTAAPGDRLRIETPGGGGSG